MTGPLLLGLGGYAAAGKDAVADVLHRNHGFAHTFMSKPLLEALLRINPLIPVEGGLVRYSELFGNVGYAKSKENPEVRRLLQTIGTDVVRNMIGENVWVDVMLADVKPILAAGGDVVVTGMRFRNEMAAVSAAGGLTVWVHRPGVGPVNGHNSDNAVSPDDFDLHLHNDGTLDDLAAAVGRLLETLARRDAA